MGENIFKYDLTDSMIDQIIYSASKESNMEKDGLYKEIVEKEKQRVIILLKPLFYAVLIAILIFSLSALIKAVNDKQIDNKIGVIRTELNNLYGQKGKLQIEYTSEVNGTAGSSIDGFGPVAKSLINQISQINNEILRKEKILDSLQRKK